jgi:hypothetical protein
VRVDKELVEVQLDYTIIDGGTSYYTDRWRFDLVDDRWLIADQGGKG